MPTLSTVAARAADLQIPLLSIMQRLGHQSLGQAAGGNHYFLSPFREEKTPSFVVSEYKNVWSDFGEAVPAGSKKKVLGGNVLDFVMKLTGVELPVARLTLRAWAGDLVPDADALAPGAGRTVTTGKVTYHDVRTEPLQWVPLLDYLVARGINWKLVQRSQRTLDCLQQIFYRIEGKDRPHPYFALGWKSTDGWEVRSRHFQGTIGGKGMTWIEGPEPHVMLFEGFMDYLSALTHYGKSAFRCTVCVLNSLSLLGQAMPRLQEATCVWSYLDNDAAGLRALRVLRKGVGTQKVKAMNEKYRGYKDFNDFLTETLPAKPLPAQGAEPSKRSQTSRYWLYAEFHERAPGTRVEDEIRRKCTFYSYTNDAAGLEYLRVLRNRLGDQLAYYCICERTEGRKYKHLEWAGAYSPKIVEPGKAAPAEDGEETDY